MYKTLWTQCRLQLLPNHFQTSHVFWLWREKEPYWFWVTGSKVKINFYTLPMKPCGQDTDYYSTVFALLLSNYGTCTNVVVNDERRDPIDFGSQGPMSRSICHSVYKTLWAWYRLQFLPNHFQTSRASCGRWKEELYWFWVLGSKVKVNFGTLWIKPCGHDADYSFCQITFKLHMHVVHDERRNPIDFGLRGQRSRSTLSLCV